MASCQLVWKCLGISTGSRAVAVPVQPAALFTVAGGSAGSLVPILLARNFGCRGLSDLREVTEVVTGQASEAQGFDF